MNHEINNSRLKQLFGLLETQPEEIFILYAIATEFKKERDYESAIKWYSKILELAPDHVATYYHLGITLHQIGQLAEALKILEKGVLCAREAGDFKSLAELNNALMNASIDN